MQYHNEELQKNVMLLNCYGMKWKKFRLRTGVHTSINSSCTVFSSISPKAIQEKHRTLNECFPKLSAQCSETAQETDRMFQKKKKNYHQVCAQHGANCECQYQVWSPQFQRDREHPDKNDQKHVRINLCGSYTGDSLQWKTKKWQIYGINIY